MMLVDLLRAASREDEALEQLAKIAGDFESRGTPSPRPATPGGETSSEAAPAPRRPAAGRGDLVFLDTGFDVPHASPAAEAGRAATAEPVPSADLSLGAGAPPPEGLERNDIVLDPLAAEPMSGLEQTVEADMLGDSVAPLPGLELDTTAEEIRFEGTPLDEIDQPDLAGVEAEPVDGLLEVSDDLDLSLAATEVDFAASAELESDLDLDFIEDEVPTAEPTAGLPLIDPTPQGTSADDLTELEDRILDDPENPDLHRELADRLLLAGDLPRASEELRLSLQGYEAGEDWAGASAIADRLVALEPDAINHHQKRVELAFRTGERSPLIEAYLALGDALGRAGALDKALAVYGRVQEHDPDNPRAESAIAALSPPPAHAVIAAPAPPALRPAPPPPAPPPPAPKAAAPPRSAPPAPPKSDSSFVDLGSMILDETTPRDTRMRIDRREPEDQDEQREFKEILEQFKRGIEENLDTDDYEAHYDLGVAFKEMGLLDEAIAEFQKALRAPEGRLRTSEALGMAFFEKGQFAVSEAVLRRAVDMVEGGDEAKIGLIYWLGRALEAQGKSADAIASYERAMAVDIRFMDLGDRIHRLTAGRRE
jgi:tetratricopeptide (TPR) repeat protein